MAHRSGIRETSWMLAFVVFSFLTVPPARAQNETSGEKIYKQTLRATTWILTPRQEGSLSMGTGSLIDLKHKLVITNYHVVGENSRVLVLFPAYRKDNKLITERQYYLDLSDAIAAARAAGHADNSDEMVAAVRKTLAPKYADWRRFDEFLALNVQGMNRWRAESA